MSIWKELYEIYISERSRWQANSQGKRALQFELSHNMTLLAEGLQQHTAQAALIAGLEVTAFQQAMQTGLNLAAMGRGKVAAKNVGDYREFKRYLGKQADELIINLYARIRTLQKLSTAEPQRDYALKLRSLLRFMVFITLYLQDKPLK